MILIVRCDRVTNVAFQVDISKLKWIVFTPRKMLTLLSELHFWSTKEDITVKDTDLGATK